MRSHPAPWATNDDYSGDPGVPTKMPPSAGQQADGYVKDLIVAPQIWNYQRWQMFRAMRDAHSMQVMNWFQSDTDSFLSAGLDYVIKAGGFNAGGTAAGDPDLHTVMMEHRPFPPTAAPAEVVAWSTGVSHGGLLWRAVSTSGLLIATVADFDTDNGINRVLVQAGAGITDGIRLSAGVIGTWTVWPGGIAVPATYTFDHVAYGHSGWVFSELTVGPGLLFFAANTAAAVAGAASDPGFGEPVAQITHSKHPAGLLWPDDIGNQVYMAVTQNYYSVTTNGTNWNSRIAHGAPTTPLDLGYSAYGTRWIMPLANGVGGPMNLHVSDSNGSSWTTLTGVVPTRTNTLAAKIASDGFGNWILTSSDTVGVLEYFASNDNGESWVPLYSTAQLDDGVTAYVYEHHLWYGGGRFHLAANTESTPGAYYRFLHSLRGGE